MFRRNKPKEPQLTPEERDRLLANVRTSIPQPEIIQQPIQQVQQPQYISQTMSQQQPIQQPKIDITQYFIGKKDVIRQRQTFETKSGQIIELPEETSRTITKDIYQLTQGDLVEIIKGVDDKKPIHQIALKMLTNQL